MEKSNLNKYTVSFGLALGIASIANALLVIAKESSPSHVMPWMKKVTGHHWSTHCLIVLVIFLLLGWLFSRFNGGKGPGLSANGLIFAVTGGVIVGCLTIMGYYIVSG